MSQYQAPLRDMKFQIEEVLDFPAHYARFAQGQEASPDIVEAILDGAAQFAENVLAPLDAVGDEHGCQWQDGEVTTPPGFKDAYQEYIANGWTSLAMPVELGGQGLPASLAGFCMEICTTANHAWTMYPGLSLGGIHTINAHGALPAQTGGRHLVGHHVPDRGSLRFRPGPAAHESCAGGRRHVRDFRQQDFHLLR